MDCFGLDLVKWGFGVLGLGFMGVIFIFGFVMYVCWVIVSLVLSVPPTSIYNITINYYIK